MSQETALKSQHVHETFAWGTTWPSMQGFQEFAHNRRVIPVVRRILADDVTPLGVYRVLGQSRPNTFLMESAEIDGAWSRYSFIGVHSRASLSIDNGVAQWQGDVPQGIPTSGKPLEVLRAALEALHTEAIYGLPPFTGGLVGAMGWDIIREWEPTIPQTFPDELNAPAMSLCLASDLAVVDHVDGSIWLIANAINFDNTDDRVEEAYANAVQRLDEMEASLEAGIAAGFSDVPRVVDPQMAEPEIAFRTTREQYSQMIAQGKEAIKDGEVFQIVLSQRFDITTDVSPLDVYRVLRTINPSPYMYYFVLTNAAGEPYSVVGSSPETLVKIVEGKITTFPIAGSRPRGATLEEDILNAKDVQEDPKEVAEHIMLVDLSRNDLVKVCEPDSVEVVEFKVIKRFSHIMHMCSTVIGKLRKNMTALDVFTATFPAGTLSGAPKNRAVELIGEYEQASRGVYGGTVGYFGFDGNMDMAIAIRTAYMKDGQAHVQAGGGIVADSQEDLEYWETRNKAAAVIRAIQTAHRLVSRTQK
ncbi:anthranilate synthase component I [Timonella sp. A28]|uniref:anthranilate synthase component I n=1 Tax=Timonella sp. A28 TaxID=3442640 RepID=UPI003EC08300